MSPASQGLGVARVERIGHAGPGQPDPSDGHMASSIISCRARSSSVFHRPHDRRAGTAAARTGPAVQSVQAPALSAATLKPTSSFGVRKETPRRTATRGPCGGQDREPPCRTRRPRPPQVSKYDLCARINPCSLALGSGPSSRESSAAPEGSKLGLPATGATCDTACAAAAITDSESTAAAPVIAITMPVATHRAVCRAGTRCAPRRPSTSSPAPAC